MRKETNPGEDAAADTIEGEHSNLTQDKVGRAPLTLPSMASQREKKVL